MTACPIFAVVVSAWHLAIAGKLHPEQADLVFVGAFSSQGQRNEDVPGLIVRHHHLIGLLEGRSSKMPLRINNLVFLKGIHGAKSFLGKALSEGSLPKMRLPIKNKVLKRKYVNCSFLIFSLNSP